jgi:hypothetical protein|nr:MAG TPA: hypothetical protein [Bacteriophage sp.]
MRIISQDGALDVPYNDYQLFVIGVLCGFGCHLEKESRFLRLKETHPKFHNLLYILKNNGVTYAEAIDWVNEHGNMNIKY